MEKNLNYRWLALFLLSSFAQVIQMACSHTTSSERPSLIILSKIALFHHYLFRSIFLIAFITVSIENNDLSLPLAYKLHEGSDFVSVVSPVLRTVLYLISNWKHDPCSFMTDSLGLCVREWSGQHLEYLIFEKWIPNPHFGVSQHFSPPFPNTYRTTTFVFL